jgi:hypothetical protein
LWCLDWHEICDGKVDCWPEPVDEQQYYELQRNECDEDQYRCHNGQCIPQEYLMDNSYASDCIDTTDEIVQSIEQPVNFCGQGDPSIRCSDVSCPYLISPLCSDTYEHYACSTGICPIQRWKRFDSFLVARTTNSHLSDECWSTMICLTKAIPTSQLVSTFIFLGLG